MTDVCIVRQKDMKPVIISHACRIAASGEQVEWYPAAKRLTFPAACRAAIGDVLTKEDLDHLFPFVNTVGQAVFSLVCSHA